MANPYSLDLLFLSAKKRELESKFGPPISHIFVKSCSRADYKGFNKELLLTSRCLSVGELEHEIERLHEELEEIRAEAKRQYAKYYGKTVQAQESKKWPPSRSLAVPVSSLHPEVTTPLSPPA